MGGKKAISIPMTKGYEALHLAFVTGGSGMGEVSLSTDQGEPGSHGKANGAVLPKRKFLLSLRENFQKQQPS